MFKKLFSKKTARKLESPEQLGVGDIIQLKYRETLPTQLREMQLEVSKVGTYEYASGTTKELVLKNAQNQVFFMSVEDDDGEVSLCFAKKISRKVVHTLFENDTFSQLWSDNWPELRVQEFESHAGTDDFQGWLDACYSQTVKDKEAYFYDHDCEGEDLSEADDGEELRFHECEGENDRYSLNVEVSGDGSTDVFLQVYCPMDVIEEMWPHDN